MSNIGITIVSGGLYVPSQLSQQNRLYRPTSALSPSNISLTFDVQGHPSSASFPKVSLSSLRLFLTCNLRLVHSAFWLVSRTIIMAPMIMTNFSITILLPIYISMTFAIRGHPSSAPSSILRLFLPCRSRLVHFAF